jgi:hypothetical protein
MEMTKDITSVIINHKKTAACGSRFFIWKKGIKTRLSLYLLIFAFWFDVFYA